MKLLGLLAVGAVVAGAGGGGTLVEGRLSVTLASRPAALDTARVWNVTFVLRRNGKPSAGERASFWIRGAGGTKTFRARSTGAGRYRAAVVFVASGVFRYGVRVGSASLALGAARVQVGLRSPGGLAVGPDGALYAADREGATVVRIDVSTRARTVVARGLANPFVVAFDALGRLAVGDSTNRIFRIGPNGAKTLLAGNGTRGHTGDGGPATAAALGGAGGMAFDGAGNLVFAEYDGWIRVVRADGTIGTLAGTGEEGYAGDGGPAAQAVIRHPHDVAVVGGAVVIADSHNGAIRRIGPDGVIRTLASGIAAPISMAAAPDGGVYVGEAGAGRIIHVSSVGELRTVATVSAPIGLAADAAGNVYVSELETRRLRRVDAATGEVTTLVP